MTYDGNCRLGDLFESRREKGQPGLPLLSVTLNDGLVARDDLERKQETNLSPGEHLLVKSGDIAYNMMRMWQGAFGLAQSDGLVSPAYVVLKPKPGLDSLYASYLLRSPRIRYLLWAFSYGITEDRLRLYFDDFARIPAYVPSIDVQKHTGKLLSAWDKAIDSSERLQDIERIRLDEITRRLLTGKSRGANRSSKDRSMHLQDCAEIITSSVDKLHVHGEQAVLLCNYTDVYYNRHLRRNHRYDHGTASQSEIERFALRVDDVVITKDSEEPSDIGVASCILDHPQNLLCGYHLAIVRPNPELVDGVVLRAFFAIESVRKHLFAQANGVTRFGLPVKAIESIELTLPSIDEQRKIRLAILAIEDQRASQVAATDVLRREKAAIEQRLFGRSQASTQTDNVVKGC